jgi:hypothetical protein
MDDDLGVVIVASEMPATVVQEKGRSERTGRTFFRRESG